MVTLEHQCFRHTLKQMVTVEYQSFMHTHKQIVTIEYQSFMHTHKQKLEERRKGLQKPTNLIEKI